MTTDQQMSVQAMDAPVAPSSTRNFRPSRLPRMLSQEVGLVPKRIAALALCTCLAACGGGASDTPLASSPALNVGVGTDTITPNVVYPGTAAAVGPTLMSQPQSVHVAVGQSARFVVAVSETDATFQWQKSVDGTSWDDMQGSIGNEITIDAATVELSGLRLRVVVKRGGKEVLSDAATLIVDNAVVAPSIRIGPASVDILEKTDAVFLVTATGTSLQYQWQVRRPDGEWVTVEGDRGSTLRFVAVEAIYSGYQVRVLVTNASGTVTSPVATMTIRPANAAVQFLGQPQSVVVTAPKPATFYANVVGQPAPALQWQSSTDGGKTFVNIAGANAMSMRVATTTVTQSGTLYRLVASNAAGQQISAAGGLTVLAADLPIYVSQQPASQSVEEGQMVEFTAAVTGSPSPDFYQWQISLDAGATFQDISGAFGTTLRFLARLADSGNRFRVSVSPPGRGNSGKSYLFSDPAILTVSPVTLFVSMRAPRIALVGQAVPLDAVVGGSNTGASVAYQWALTTRPASSTASISAPTAASTAFLADVPGVYDAEVTVTNAGGKAWSTHRVLTSYTAAQANQLATASGCMACHATDRKIVGPAFVDIARKYQASNDIVVALSAKVIFGGSGAWGAIPMPPVAGVSPEAAELMTRWILSLK